MRKNWIHYLLAVLFFLFGIVQYNDPDFYLWMPAYIIIGIIPILYAKYAFPENTVIGLTILYILWMAMYFPDIISWIQNDTPSIAKSMKAETPYIEVAREFFGLLFCVSILITYLIMFKKRSK